MLYYTVSMRVMLWSRGGGCAWLSLSLSSSLAAPSLAALVYLVSLLVAPLATAVYCGEASLPSAQSVAATLLTATGPFCAGAALVPPAAVASASASGGGAAPSRGDKLCALVLLYAECCERLSEAEGAPQPADVLATLALEVCVVAASCGLCAVYCRLGILGSRDATTLALCAVPRALDTQWESAWCVSAGAVRLPGAFLAPAQALLLAALVPDRSERSDRSDVTDRSERPDVTDRSDRPDVPDRIETG